MTKVTYELTSAVWWKSAGIRALRTAFAVFLPLITASTFLELDWLVAASTVGLAIIASFLTSLVGLSEVSGKTVPFALAVSIRAIKTFAQTALSYIGAAVLISDVNWSSLLALSVSATVVTLLTGFITGLPEEEDKSLTVG